MDNGVSTADLSAEEQAYFESGGETELKVTPEVATPEPEQPQVQPQEETQQTERDDKGRFVPHQALHAEREEHKKTKALVDDLAKRHAVLEDRWNTLLKLREGQPQQEEQQPPDPEQDIFGYAKWQSERLKALETKLADGEKQTEQQRQMEAQERELWNDWSMSANAYAAQKPDFGDALTWLSDFRSKQLQAMSLIDERFASPAGINQQINSELRAIVAAAKQKSLNPAEVVHNMAISYGFKAKAADQQNTTLPEQLAKVATAQEAAKTVGAAPGRSGGDALTPEAIAAMSAAEFDRWAADPANARLLDKMLGA